MSDAYRILVTGSRHWKDAEVVRVTLGRLVDRAPRHAVIVHGAHHEGADLFAAQYCAEHNVEADPHPAEWAKYERQAGPIRNSKMVDLGADLCVAFWDGRVKGSGTFDCFSKAVKGGIRVMIVPAKGPR